MEEKDTILQEKHHGTVIYVEPNHISEYNIQHETRIETSVPLEDLAIYCNLEVKVYDRMSSEVKSFFRLEVATTKAETTSSKNIDDIKFGYFMQGTPYGDIRAFTTDYTNMGYKEISNGKQNIAMFGINSINISYDAWLCPTVDIKFTDVRGISLFTAQEIGHNGYRVSDGMNGLTSEDEDAISSFFGAFFQFPYPSFKLWVKGFYGEPVSYDLAINDLKTSFDSQTGNFNIDVNFVGFKFGILNDLTMTSLAACVSSSEGDIGGKYWEQQISNGRFKYNEETNLLKVSDIAAMYEQYESAVKVATQQIEQDIEQKVEKNDLGETLKEYVTEYYNAVVETGKAIMEKSKEYYNSVFNKISANPDASNLCIQRTFSPKNLHFQQLSNTMPKEMSEKINYWLGDTSKDYMVQWSELDFASGTKGSENRFIPSYARVTNITQKVIDGKMTLWGDVKENGDCHDTLQRADNFDSCGNKKYVRPFKENSWSIQLLSGYNQATCNIGGKNYKTKFENIGQGLSNYEIAEEKGVGKAYKALMDKINEMEGDSAITDENKTKLSSIKTEVEKIALYKLKPSLYDINQSHVLFPLPSNIETCTFHADTNANVMLTCPVSRYTVDFTPLSNLLSEQSGVNSENFSNEKQQAITRMEEEMLDKYLNFNTSIMYITKSLWGHVETFLDMCMKTKINIVGSERKVTDLNLTKENSNLPRAYYTNTDLKVPPFPIVTEKQVISGSSNERLVHGYLGDENIAPNAPEVTMVNTLLDGAADYWNIIHTSSGSEQSVQAQTYRQHEKEISIGVYMYLRNIFEKWIHSMSTSESNYVISNWGVDNYFDTHFLFIDTFYNKINDAIGINPRTFAKACHDIFEHKTNTLMSFMTSYMQENNVILQPTQGFMLNTIENKNDILQYYKKIFTPIPYTKMKAPESAPYFVAIYRGTASANLDMGTEKTNENDSFMISYDDSNMEIPVGLEKKDISDDKGYVIPAIGIEYGKQYQNYFIDLQVNMNAPAANEVSIAAQYNLAGISTSDNSGGNEQNVRLGQDLYTVYANNSYQCTVKMLGCMWMQPLMYFQLNNVPMFRGTYMIQKVTHSISVGNMITEFTGVRMSKYSSPFVNRNLVFTGNAAKKWLEAKEKAASFDNDCPYHKFDPNGEDEGGGGCSMGTNTFSMTWLNNPFSTNFTQGIMMVDPKGEGFSLSKWYNKVKNMKTKYAIASMIKQENSSDAVSIQLHASLIFNEINSCMGRGKGTGFSKEDWSSMWNGHRYCAIRDGAGANLTRVLAYLDTVNDSDAIVKQVVNVFTKSPCIAAGGKTNGNGDNGIDEIRHVSPSGITVKALQSVFYASNNGTFLFSHAGSAYYSYNDGKHRVGCVFWEPISSSTPPAESQTPKDTPDNYGAQLLDCIKRTFDFNDSMSSAGESFTTFFKEKIDTKTKTFTFNLIDSKKSVQSARLIDILINVYQNNISRVECSWNSTVSNIGKDDNPTDIVAYYSEVTQGAMKISFKQGNTLIAIKQGSFPDAIIKVLKKKFDDLSDKKASSCILNKFAEVPKQEVKNEEKQNDKKEEKKEA